jgi:hypothetical protein
MPRWSRAWGVPDAIVSDDAYSTARNDIEAVPLDDLRTTEAAAVFLVRLPPLVLPIMKAVLPNRISRTCMIVPYHTGSG